MGGWNTWVSCRDGDLLRAGVRVRGCSILGSRPLMSSQRLEHLCRGRDPRLGTAAIHARLRRIYIAAKLWYMVM